MGSDQQRDLFPDLDADDRRFVRVPDRRRRTVKYEGSVTVPIGNIELNENMEFASP
jgi:hypothetical protein